MKINSLLIVTLCLLSDFAYANDVDLELGLLSKKIGLCESSIVNKRCSNTKFCKDMDGYVNYLFKDSASAYFEYHLKVGNINNKNTDKFISNMQRYQNISELRREEAINGSKCQ